MPAAVPLANNTTCGVGNYPVDSWIVARLFAFTGCRKLFTFQTNLTNSWSSCNIILWIEFANTQKFCDRTGWKCLESRRMQKNAYNLCEVICVFLNSWSFRSCFQKAELKFFDQLTCRWAVKVILRGDQTIRRSVVIAEDARRWTI